MVECGSLSTSFPVETLTTSKIPSEELKKSSKRSHSLRIYHRIKKKCIEEGRKDNFSLPVLLFSHSQIAQHREISSTWEIQEGSHDQILPDSSTRSASVKLSSVHGQFPELPGSTLSFRPVPPIQSPGSSIPKLALMALNSGLFSVPG